MKDKKDDQSKLSEAELQAAIRRFLEAGGIIEKLPEQKAAGARKVGMRWNGSELTSELS